MTLSIFFKGIFVRLLTLSEKNGITDFQNFVSLVTFLMSRFSWYFFLSILLRLLQKLFCFVFFLNEVQSFLCLSFEIFCLVLSSFHYSFHYFERPLSRKENEFFLSPYSLIAHVLQCLEL